MVRRVRETVYGVLLVLLASWCRADITPAMVLKAKQATVLVEVENAEGSAFCIDAEGLFVTNAHVVDPLNVGGRLKLILHSGELDQKIVSAHVIALDKDADLALLQADAPPKLTPLALGSTDGLIETMAIVAFGYPFGSELAVNKGDYPSITVSTGHITALRKSRGDLKAIQLDASLNPGNSGGPVLNDKGEVIAIVQEGIPGSGINSAIPISSLGNLLSRNHLRFIPPLRPGEHLEESQEFRIQLMNPPKGGGEISVDLTLSADAGDHRTFHASSTDGRIYTVRAPLLPTLKNPAASLDYHLTAKQNGKVFGDLTGKISLADRNILPRQSLAAVRPPTASNLAEYEIVVSCFATNDIRRFDARTGAYLGKFETGNGLAGPQDMLWGPDGCLYVACAHTSTVLRYNGITGKFIDAFIPAGSGGLHNAHAMTFGPDGNLYVISHLSSEIKRYDGKTGAFLDNFIPNGSGGLYSPAGLRFGPDGNLYVASQQTQEVKRYNGKTGAYLGNFATGHGLHDPGAIEFADDGYLYICSASSSEIKRYNGKTGEFVDTLITSQNSKLDYPLGMLFAPDGTLYVTGRHNTFKRFDRKTGAFLNDFSTGMESPERMLYHRKPVIP